MLLKGVGNDRNNDRNNNRFDCAGHRIVLGIIGLVMFFIPEVIEAGRITRKPLRKSDEYRNTQKNFRISYNDRIQTLSIRKKIK